MTVTDLFSVKNKRALVTGGASGIGLAISEALAESGARVGIVDQNKDALEREASRLTRLGYKVDAQQGDVSSSDITGIIATTIERLGGLDILFANAGITGGPGPAAGQDGAGYFERIDMSQWHRTINVNLTGVVHT